MLILIYIYIFPTHTSVDHSQKSITYLATKKAQQIQSFQGIVSHHNPIQLEI